MKHNGKLQALDWMPTLLDWWQMIYPYEQITNLIIIIDRFLCFISADLISTIVFIVLFLLLIRKKTHTHTHIISFDWIIAKYPVCFLCKIMSQMSTMQSRFFEHFLVWLNEEVKNNSKNTRRHFLVNFQFSFI